MFFLLHKRHGLELSASYKFGALAVAVHNAHSSDPKAKTEIELSNLRRAGAIKRARLPRWRPWPQQKEERRTPKAFLRERTVQWGCGAKLTSANAMIATFTQCALVVDMAVVSNKVPVVYSPAVVWLPRQICSASRSES